MAADTAHVRRLSARLVEGVRAQLEHVVFNGDEDNTYEGCLNLSFAYVEVSKGMASGFTHLPSLYMVNHLLVDLGWVDLDLGVPPSCRA